MNNNALLLLLLNVGITTSISILATFTWLFRWSRNEVYNWWDIIFAESAQSATSTTLHWLNTSTNSSWISIAINSWLSWGSDVWWTAYDDVAWHIAVYTNSWTNPGMNYALQKFNASTGAFVSRHYTGWGWSVEKLVFADWLNWYLLNNQSQIWLFDKSTNTITYSYTIPSWYTCYDLIYNTTNWKVYILADNWTTWNIYVLTSTLTLDATISLWVKGWFFKYLNSTNEILAVEKDTKVMKVVSCSSWTITNTIDFSANPWIKIFDIMQHNARWKLYFLVWSLAWTSSKYIYSVSPSSKTVEDVITSSWITSNYVKRLIYCTSTDKTYLIYWTADWINASVEEWS